jgi:tripartite-type tricarboxylate transporter receptor subunit TctC
MKFVARGIGVLALLLLTGGVSRADPVADFYRGKQINLIVGSAPGGGYDAYARVLAHHIGRYIPGNPAIIVQNMPGSGGLRAANHLFNVAPKDGTAIATFAHDLVLVGALGQNQNVRFDTGKFVWLGSSSSFANDAYLLIARAEAAVKSIEDARRPGGPPLLMGVSAEGGGTNDITNLVRDALGLNLKPVSGYPGSNALFLAIDRGEIDGRFTALSVLQVTRPQWLTPTGGMRVLLQFARTTRHPLFPDVPTARELAGNAVARSLIELAELPYMLDRPFIAPPGVEPDRSAALQAAFLAAHRDAQYLEEAARLKIDVSPIGGADVPNILARIGAAPQETLEYMKQSIAKQEPH